MAAFGLQEQAEDILSWTGRVVGRLLTLDIFSRITQSIACLMQVVMNNSLVYYGDLDPIGSDMALSVMGIVMKISMIRGTFGAGVGIRAQPILRFNRGAKKYSRIRKTYLTAAVFATLLTFMCWVVCQTMPEHIITIFGNENANFTDFAIKCLRIYLFNIFCASFYC